MTKADGADKNSKEKKQKPEKPLAGGQVREVHGSPEHLKGRRFVITSAQNNTYVHEGFVRALESYCEKNGAQLVVSKFSYNANQYRSQNPAAEVDSPELLDNREKVAHSEIPEASKVKHQWFDPRIEQYYVEKQRFQVADGLQFCSETNILPTQVNPFAGYENYTRGQSGIFPHSTQAMTSLPGMKDVDGARFLYSTGTCTQRNYIQRSAGQKADANHIYGALVVEVDDNGEWFVRQIAADENGAFYDLDKKYMPNGKILEGQRPEAINWGDIHIEKVDPVALFSSIGPGGMLDTLKPKLQVFNDTQDFSHRNHHNLKDPNFWTAEHFSPEKPSVEKGLSLTAQFMKAAERPEVKSLVVNGNHDEYAFRKWLNEADTRFDPNNRAFWHECNAKLARETEYGNKDFNVFEWAVREKADLMQTHFLPIDTSYVICETSKNAGIELGLHGDIAANGAKGSGARSFRNIGMRANIGHTHTAAIFQGVFVAGTMSKLDMDYNKGPSSWSHSDILTYPNGKRTIITKRANGKWCLDSQPVDKKQATALLKDLKKSSEQALKRGPAGPSPDRKVA